MNLLMSLICCSINKINIHFQIFHHFLQKIIYKNTIFFSKNQVKLPLNTLNNADIKIKLELESIKRTVLYRQTTNCYSKKK